MLLCSLLQPATTRTRSLNQHHGVCVLCLQGVGGISGIITTTGQINVDFADIKAVRCSCCCWALTLTGMQHTAKIVRMMHAHAMALVKMTWGSTCSRAACSCSWQCCPQAVQLLQQAEVCVPLTRGLLRFAGVNAQCRS